MGTAMPRQTQVYCAAVAALWAGESLLATCSAGEGAVKMWDLKNEDNWGLDMPPGGAKAHLVAASFS